MSEEEAIKFAGLMEDYLNIPSFVCEMIEKQLEDNKYKEVVEYIIQRRNEIESKEDYISQQQAINMWITKLEEKDKEIERLKRKIKIKDEWCDRIWEVGTDYDGYRNNLEELRNLVDELIEYSNKAKSCDDKSVAYISYEKGKKFEENILGEKIGSE